jgi:glycosyltransferase involved in cell wall biosynthesis
MVQISRSPIKHVFVLSNASVESMRVLGFGACVSKMPLGFDPKVFRPDAAARERIRASLDLNAPVIAYIGRMVEGKGIEYLIEALGTMLDLQWYLIMDDFESGDAPDYARRMREKINATAGVADRVRFFHADHYRIAAYINAADIIVAPSCLSEQYGRSLAEAMACGKIVIASDAGAYPELVGDSGVVVPKANSAALAAVLRKAITDPAWAANVGEKAAIMAHEKLSMNSQADIIEGKLKELIDQPAMFHNRRAGN